MTDEEIEKLAELIVAKLKPLYPPAPPTYPWQQPYPGQQTPPYPFSPYPPYYQVWCSI